MQEIWTTRRPLKEGESGRWENGGKNPGRKGRHIRDKASFSVDQEELLADGWPGNLGHGQHKLDRSKAGRGVDRN